MSMKMDPTQESTSTQPTFQANFFAKRIAIDTASAATAAALVSPIVAIIDRSIIERTILSKPILQTFRSSLTSLLRNPSLLATKPYTLLTTLYFSTFLTANTIDTLAEAKNLDGFTHNTAKFVGVSVVNISLGIYKDAQLTKLFGGGVAKAVPKGSIALFILRDCVTIFGSFTLPNLAAGAIEKASPAKSKSAEVGLQLGVPAFIQLFSTPVHLLGLDLYGRAGKEVSWKSRSGVVRRNYGISCAARVCRIVPAFGVGGVVNARMRGWFLDEGVRK